jgi:hypothetical protein
MSKILIGNTDKKRPSILGRCGRSDKSCELLHVEEFCERGFCSWESELTFGEDKRWISWKISELLTKYEVTHRYEFSTKKILDLKFYFVFGNIGLKYQSNDVHLYFKLPLLFFMLIMFPVLKYDTVQKSLSKQFFHKKCWILLATAISSRNY